MSKLANILKMIILLKSNGKMKIKDLSEILEISERMVRKYKDEFEQVGIYIGSTSGINGGYYIENDVSLLELGINKEEYSSILMAYEELKNNNYIFIKEYNNALNKIGAAMKEKDMDNAETMIIGSKPNIDLNSERKKYLDIHAAIVTKNKIEMSYFSLGSGVNRRIVRPYAVFMYKEFWYFIGHCELRDEIREFKLSRIKEYIVLEEKFEKPTDFSLSEYMKNGIGIMYDNKDTSEFKVKLRIQSPTSIIVMERLWAENQQITYNGKNG